MVPTRNLNRELDLAGEALGPRGLSGSTLCSSRTTHSRMPCTMLRRRTGMEAVCFPGAPSTLGRALWWDVGGIWSTKASQKVPRVFLQRPVFLKAAFMLGLVPNGERTIPSPNLRHCCQTTTLLAFYQFFFFRIEIWCLLLILQVEREEGTASVPLPPPLHLHPASH